MQGDKADQDNTHYNSAVLEQMRNRSSVRAYQPRDVPDSMLESILNAACQAPTSSNLQAYSLIVVRDQQKRQSIAAIAGGQQHIEAAPVFIAVCADLNRLDRVCNILEQDPATDLCEMNLVAIIDATLVGMCAATVAESLGLGSVMIGGVRNDPLHMADLLGLPSHTFVVFGLCLGWPLATPPAKPRLPALTVVHRERYNDPLTPSMLSGYDQTLSAHHRHIGRDNGAIWSERVAKLCTSPHRSQLKDALAKLGFHFA